MLSLFIVAIGAFLAGLIQSVTGFGGAIILMIVLPFFLSLKTATALAGLICIPACIRVAVVYRKQIARDQILLPLVIYMISSTICIRIAAGTNLEQYKFIFGVLLVLLAIYFSLFSGKITIRPGLGGAVICAGLAGVTGGVFGMSGPVLVLYYLSILEEKRAYLGTISLLLAIIEIYSAGVRLMNGMIDMSMISWIVCGFIAIMAGSRLGEAIVDRINGAVLKKCVYVVLAAAGIITCIKAL